MIEFSEQERAALEQWLASPVFNNKALGVIQLQGFFCAVISAPDTIPASRWMPDALGSELAYESLEQAQEFMDLLTRFYTSVSTALADGQAPGFILKPQATPDQAPDYPAWCDGYILGWGLSTEEWLQPGNEVLKKLTFPILLLSGAFKEDAERNGGEFMPDEEYAKLQQECMDVLPGAVAGIYNFWHARSKNAPVKRDTPKVGRNESCPCGSGKKFKQCCGAERTLH
ncbi:MAG: UPF0149 family protein [Sulfuricella sp.]|jgi:uncharacterized protein